MSENVRQKIGYGIGAMGKDVVYAFVSGFILYYYNTVLGISGTFTGVMMMAARVFDAFNDPLMGVVVEKTNTRMGKFRPWILTGTVTNALILVRHVCHAAFRAGNGDAGVCERRLCAVGRDVYSDGHSVLEHDPRNHKSGA